MFTREWIKYALKGVCEETEEYPWPKKSEEEIEAYKNNELPNYLAHILQLPQPILCVTEDCTDIITIEIKNKKLRLYPPFPLNSTQEIKCAFNDIKIPEGENNIDHYIPFPYETVPAGLLVSPQSTPNTTYCQGLRIDSEIDAPLNDVLQILLEQITQHTSQWWIRSGTSPFIGFDRFESAINRDFSIRELLKYSGAGSLESTLYPVTSTQAPFGLGKLMTNDLWVAVCNHTSKGYRGDSGLLLFFDAISNYMSGNDTAAVLQLCICVEVLGNKQLILSGKKPTDFNNLIRRTKLVGDKEKEILKKMFIDRGHIAHGKIAYLMGKIGQPNINDYIETTLAIVDGYINSLDTENWPDASQMQINRKSKP